MPALIFDCDGVLADTERDLRPEFLFLGVDEEDRTTVGVQDVTDLLGDDREEVVDPGFRGDAPAEAGQQHLPSFEFLSASQIGRAHV